jgi:hypothetical protein
MVFVYYKGGKCGSMTKEEFDKEMRFHKNKISDYAYIK